LQPGEAATPSATGLHVPIDPARLQRSHCPLHAVLQQTPSAQRPDWHWDERVQAVPNGARPVHPPSRHDAVAAQSAAVLHVAGQLGDVPSQR
jgi:hypothetical protein